MGGDAPLPLEQIRACLLSNGYREEFLKRGFRRVYTDPALFQFTIGFLRDVCGMELGISSPSDRRWYAIYSGVVAPLVRGELAATKEKGQEQPEAVVVTPAVAIYYALFQLYGDEAPRRMYEILEPIMVPRLSGEGNGAELLFYPVQAQHLDRQVAVVEEVLKAEPRICGVPFFVSLFCSKTKRLSAIASRRCASLLSEACRRVGGGG